MLASEGFLWSIGSIFVLLQGGTGEPAPTGGGLLSLLPMFALIYLAVYFMLIRPQKKEQRRHSQLLEALKKNDQVRTSAGIFGKVVTVDKEKDQVVLKIDDQNNVRLRVLRSSIVAIASDRDKETSPAS